MEDNIVRLTNEYILQSGISKLPVKFEDLKRSLKKAGCLVFSYGEAHNIIDKLQLRRYTSQNAFLVPLPDAEDTLVLYKDTLSYGARQLALAHELGHIVLGHAHCSVLEKSHFEDTAQEREAEIFARQLLAPCCILRRLRIRTVKQIVSNTLLDEEQAGIVYVHLRHSRKDPYQEELYKQFNCNRDRSLSEPLAFFLVVSVGLLSAIVAYTAISSRSSRTPSLGSEASSITRYQSDPILEITSPSTTISIASETVTSISTTASETIQNQRMVYVTADGEKYHAEGCQHLYRNGEMKDNLRYISEEQALAEGYTPCSVCGG